MSYVIDRDSYNPAGNPEVTELTIPKFDPVQKSEQDQLFEDLGSNLVHVTKSDIDEFRESSPSSER